MSDTDRLTNLIIEDRNARIKALEKENERLNDLGAKQATSLEEAYTELQKLKDDRDSIKEELDELYKGGDPIGMMVRASANSYRDMKEFVNKKLDELLNQKP